MDLRDLLLRAARSLDRLATEIENGGPSPVTAPRPSGSGATASGRLAQTASTAAQGAGLRSAEAMAAFRANFSTNCLMRWDAACAAEGLERKHTWFGFMDDWADQGRPALGPLENSAPGREVYRLAGRSSSETITFLREPGKGWVIDEVNTAGSFAATIERMRRR